MLRFVPENLACGMDKSMMKSRERSKAFWINSLIKEKRSEWLGVQLVVSREENKEGDEEIERRER